LRLAFDTGNKIKIRGKTEKPDE
jgi:uncharacterized protein (TIGR02145 family)